MLPGLITYLCFWGRKDQIKPLVKSAKILRVHLPHPLWMKIEEVKKGAHLAEKVDDF